MSDVDLGPITVDAAIELMRTEMGSYVPLDRFAANLEELAESVAEFPSARAVTEQILRDKRLSDADVRKVRRASQSSRLPRAIACWTAG